MTSLEYRSLTEEDVNRLRWLQACFMGHAVFLGVLLFLALSQFSLAQWSLTGVLVVVCFFGWVIFENYEASHMLEHESTRSVHTAMILNLLTGPIGIALSLYAFCTINRPSIRRADWTD